MYSTASVVALGRVRVRSCAQVFGLVAALALVPVAAFAQSTGWQSTDIGSPTVAGNATIGSDGTITITGGGAGIGALDTHHTSQYRGDYDYTVFGTSDSFQFYWQQLSGDSQIVARVTSVTSPSDAQAAVMIRESLDASAQNVAGIVNGRTSQWRTSRAGPFSTPFEYNQTVFTPLGYAPIPLWIKLVRGSGGVLMYTSVDGVTWIEASWRTISLPDTVYLGLGVSDRVADGSAVATFDHVSVGPAAVPIQAPIPSDDFAAAEVGADYAKFTWTNSNSAYERLQLERSDDNGSTFHRITAWPEPTTSTSDHNLAAGKHYLYRMAVVRGSMTSYSNVVAVDTPAIVLTAGDAWSSRINVTWTCAGAAENWFMVQYSTDGVNFSYGDYPGARDARSYSIDGLFPNSTYYIRVGCYQGSSASAAYSNTIVVNTTATPPPGSPAAPSNLRLARALANGVELLWDDNSTNERGFELQRSVDGTTFQTLYSSYLPNITIYDDTYYVALGKTYTYRIRAYNDSGYSDAAPPLSVTVSAFDSSVIAGAPTNLAASSTVANDIHLTWTNNSADAIGFDIQRSLDGNAFGSIGTAPGNATAYDDTAFSVSSSFYYRVRAITNAGATGPSNVVFGQALTPPSSDVVPVITSVNGPYPGLYGRTGVLRMSVNFDPAVQVTGTPNLLVKVGPVTHQAHYVSGSGTQTLVFEYNIAMDNGPVSLVSPIDLNGGTIRSLANTDANLSFTPPDTSNVSVDTTPPVTPEITWAAQSSTPGFGGTAEAGSRVQVSTPWNNGTYFAGETTTASNGGWSITWQSDPLPPGTYYFSALSIDPAGNTSEHSSLIRVDVPTPSNTGGGSGGSTPPEAQGPVINSPTSLTINAGSPFSYTISATNSPTSYGVSTTLPGWLQFDAASHTLSGTPGDAGTFTVGLTATNGAGTGSATLTITVAAAPSGGSTKSDQTISFSSPTGAVVIGVPISLGAFSSSGLPITYQVVSGDASLNGDVLTPLSTAKLVVRASSAGDTTYNAATTDVNFGAPQKTPQMISFAAISDQRTDAGPISLAATSTSGLPISYTLVSGPAKLVGNTLTLTGDAGTVTVRATQPGSDTVAAANDVTLSFAVTSVPLSRLVNLSTRLHVSAGDAEGASIAGFVVTGSTPKQILIRAVGPSLAQFGVAQPLPDARLRLVDGKGAVVATNDGWDGDAQIAAAAKSVSAFPFVDGSSDAALLVTLQPGQYTAQVSSSHSGTALIEVYDMGMIATNPTRQLINISSRGHVGVGDNVLIGGFVVAGTSPKRVLIRAVGPGLTQFGVGGVLSDPILAVYDSNNTVIARNFNWGSQVSADGGASAGSADVITEADTATGAFPLADGSADAAVVLTLNPGQYSAIVSGAGNSTGAAMVEIYEVP
jgi:hypothetical protein